MSASHHNHKVIITQSQSYSLYLLTKNSHTFITYLMVTIIIIIMNRQINKKTNINIIKIIWTRKLSSSSSNKNSYRVWGRERGEILDEINPIIIISM